MIFSENLKKNNIIVNAKSDNRWSLIEEMLNTAIKSKDVKEKDRDIIKNALIEREKSMTTGIGKGIAIPHCATSKIDDAIIVLALCHQGIDFNSIDNQPVNIAILLLIPNNKLKQHIKTLANIARVISDKRLRETLLNLKNQESIFKAICEYEKNL
ncbi:MAG: PTS sugar transporter subunit IIA [Spirochaetota bacterium]|nr:PTS sugar transporter subunit IIA [Spirochaetota bacterium]